MDNTTLAFIIGYSSLAIAVLVLMLKFNRAVHEARHNFEIIQQVIMMQAMHMKTLQDSAKDKSNV